MYLVHVFKAEKMKLLFKIYHQLQPLFDAGFRRIGGGTTGRQIVVPMLYPRNQKPLQLNSSKGFRMLKVGATGFEPVTLCL